MVQEEWRDIVIEKNGITYDYTGLYQVSNLGRVKRLGNNKNAHEKILKPGTLWKGHQQVSLSKDNKVVHFKVHQLVATMFIQNPNNLPIVNHKDENPLNNNVDNLEWCTHKYNVQYSYNLHKEERYQHCVKGGKARGGTSNPHNDKWCEKISESKGTKVICLETLDIFVSIREANKWCHGDVSRHVKGKQKHAGRHPITREKLHWMYYEDWLKLQENKREDDIL